MESQADLFGGEIDSVTDSARVESFYLDPVGSRVVRRVMRRDGTAVESDVPLTEGVDTDDLAASFDGAWLRAVEPPPRTAETSSIRIVDLFAGCGALTLGVSEACRALGLREEHVLAVDFNEKALEAYKRNFPEVRAHVGKVEDLFDGELGSEPTGVEVEIRRALGRVDILVGGPPCQGHSNLNNHTRRSDPKNALYLRMARFAEVVRPEHIIIENVPGVVHDRGGVVQETWKILGRLGYRVEPIVVDAERIGVAQRRRRFFTVASLNAPLGLERALQRHFVPPRTVKWAISDLLDVVGSTAFDTAATHSAANQARIAYLFEHNLYDLPNSERPDCHRLKPHSYTAVYGRLMWDDSAPTITTGFGSTGQGRNVHPARPRTLTPHEAARLQFIPDFFELGEQRAALQQMIGNAVPPKMGYVLALELLR